MRVIFTWFAAEHGQRAAVARSSDAPRWLADLASEVVSFRGRALCNTSWRRSIEVKRRRVSEALSFRRTAPLWGWRGGHIGGLLGIFAPRPSAQRWPPRRGWHTKCILADFGGRPDALLTEAWGDDPAMGQRTPQSCVFGPRRITPPRSACSPILSLQQPRRFGTTVVGFVSAQHAGQTEFHRHPCLERQLLQTFFCNHEHRRVWHRAPT